MIGHAPRHTAFCVKATMGLVASNRSSGSAGRPEGASFSVSAQTVTLAARCDLQFPVASVHIRAHNHGNAPSSATNIRVLDTAHELAGSAELPQLAAHESRSIDNSSPSARVFDPSKNPAAFASDRRSNRERRTDARVVTTPSLGRRRMEARPLKHLVESEQHEVGRACYALGDR